MVLEAAVEDKWQTRLQCFQLQKITLHLYQNVLALGGYQVS